MPSDNNNSQPCPHHVPAHLVGRYFLDQMHRYSLESGVDVTTTTHRTQLEDTSDTTQVVRPEPHDVNEMETRDDDGDDSEEKF